MSDKAREEFEAWAASDGYQLDASSDARFTYDFHETECAWYGWKASRASPAVNACAGMADPAAEIAELKRKRDELLALAERLVQWDLDYPVNCYNGYAGLQALNAIIRDNKVAITKGHSS